MKFLEKRNDSEILQNKIAYKNNNAENNRELKQLLINEQHCFCAYTERYMSLTDSIEVEHFNQTLKGIAENYYNYYAVFRFANINKKDKEYRKSAENKLSFFGSLFFQKPNGFADRICFENNLYKEKDENDLEAKELIDFLNLNDARLYNCKFN